MISACLPASNLQLKIRTKAGTVFPDEIHSLFYPSNPKIGLSIGAVLSYAMSVTIAEVLHMKNFSPYDRTPIVRLAVTLKEAVWARSRHIAHNGNGLCTGTCPPMEDENR